MVVTTPQPSIYSPLVSCVCPTYNRTQQLEEAIMCFLDQTYSNKELIIVNDNPNTKLFIANSYGNIHIVNCSSRFKNLGAKRNFFKSLILGKYVCIWDDDDLYGFNRIEESVTNFDHNFDLIKPASVIYYAPDVKYDTLKSGQGMMNSSACYTREFYNSTDYINISVGEDSDYESKAKHKYLSIDLFWYVYRWGGWTHISGINESDQYETFKAKTTYKSGAVQLNPHYYHNYWKDIQRYLITYSPEIINRYNYMYKRYL